MVGEKLFLKAPLTEELLLVDGLVRAGKMLTAKIVSHMDGIEFIQVRESVDHVPMLLGVGKLDHDSAKAFLRLQLDVAIHDRAIGRNLNLRKADATSVYFAPDYPSYSDRAEESADEAALSKFLSSGQIPFFFTHQVLPFISLFFDVAKGLRVLEVVRHPVTLAASWHGRGWGERWGKDPRVFTVMADRGGHAIPWFALDWADEFVRMSPMDRAIRCILDLLDRCEEAVGRLSPTQAKRLFWIPYEHLTARPSATVDGISAFLGKQPLKTMEDVFVREKLPKPTDPQALVESARLVADNGSPDLVDRLFETARTYEARWDLDPLSRPTQ